MVGHVSNPSSWETEVKGLQVQGQPGLLDPVSKKKFSFWKNEFGIVGVISLASLCLKRHHLPSLLIALEFSCDL
jgi:hypothetical protein